MYIELIGSALILVSSTLIGTYYSQLYKRRTSDLCALKKALIILRGEINYSLSPMPDALDNVSRRFDHEISVFFKSVSEELKKNSGKTLTEVWKKKAEEELNKTFLNKTDIYNVMSFSENLGYLDKEMQNNNINLLIDQVNQEIKASVNNDNKYSKLYRSLGVLGGILVVVIFM